MRRFLAILLPVAIVLSLSGAVLTLASAATGSTLDCANPQKLTSSEGTIHFPGNLTVQQDEWSPRSGETQTMLVCDPTSWEATVSVGGQPSDGVTTYPDSGTTYPDNCSQVHKFSEIKSLTSDYGAKPPTQAASWDYAYDLFTGGGVCSTQQLANLRAAIHGGAKTKQAFLAQSSATAEPFTEIMVWDKWSDISVPNAQIKNAMIDGVAYDIYHSGGYVQVRRVNQNVSGSVNLGHIIAWLAYSGVLRHDVHLIFTQDGYEVLTTFGQPVTFPLTNFAVNEQLK